MYAFFLFVILNNLLNKIIEGNNDNFRLLQAKPAANKMKPKKAVKGGAKKTAQPAKPEPKKLINTYLKN